MRGMISMLFYHLLERIIKAETYTSKEAMQTKIDDWKAKGRITDTQKAELERLLYLTDKKEEAPEPK